MTSSMKTYLWRLGAAFVVYALFLIGSIVLLVNNPDASWRIPVALSPMAPALCILWAVIRGIAEMDELQRRIQLEGLAFGFGGTAIVTLSYGFLQNVGFPPLSMFVVWPVMAVLWILGLRLATRRYR